MPLPRIAITVGDPAGIGPEIAAQAADDGGVRAVCAPILYGARDDAARDDAARDGGGAPPMGAATAAGGRRSYDAVVAATADAVAGRVDAVATAPINKTAWAMAGLPWRGHTELLAELTGARRVAMMFHAERLRVVLATTHVPLAEVPRRLTRQRIEEVVALAHEELPRFGCPRPRLVVAGLNPHAGESGLLGEEDERVVRPAIEACRARGIVVSGPEPADTVFVRALRGAFDVVVACYHDQGLIPIKLVAFGQAVNVTLGLPIVRTSVDHGTAYDIAGRGVADPSSMIAAVRLAATLASAAGRRAADP